MAVTPKRNDKCSCGSGKKYKNCCMPKGNMGVRLQTEHELDQVRQLIKSKQLQQAISLLENLVTRAPNHAEAVTILGMLQTQVGNIPAAIKSLRRSVQLAPKNYGNYFNLGSLQLNVGDFKGAQRTFYKAAKAQPNALEWDLLKVVAMAPEFIDSVSQIESIMQELEITLSQLEASNKKIQDLENLRGNLFHIGYYGVSTLEIQRRISKLMVERLDSTPQSSTKSSESMKLRVGFLSGLMRDHTIGKLNAGLIQKLDREKFHVVVIHLFSSKNDQRQYEIDCSADEVVRLTANTTASARVIDALKLDILHYLDIGMNAFTHRLAHFRLAPVQSTSWGHPVTTGIPNMDYFITFGLSEPEDGRNHYSENLINFANPPTFYERPKVVLSPELELPAGNLYGCLQSLFKLHPEFDDVLESIVSLDRSATIVLVEAENKSLTDQVMSRWAKRGGVLIQRSVFLPRMNGKNFLSVVKSMDVLLDPAYFGSGNTLFESMSLGIPSVTWPGPFMRGRIAAALYEYIEVEDPPVVERLSDYAECATNLVSDFSRLSRLKREIEKRSALLYENRDVISEFEGFFLSVAKRAQ